MKTLIYHSIRKLFFSATMVIILMSQLANAQTKSFSVTASKDSVLMGNTIKVEFVIKNAEGKFEAPAFEQFDIISGPNTASSMYSINGEVSSTLTYTYYMQPKSEGDLFIENAYLIFESDESKNMETKALKIVAIPNPKGIIEEDDSTFSNNFFFSFPGNDMLLEPSPKIQNPPTQEKKTTKKLKRI